VRQHPFLTDLGFTALNGVHPGVLRACEGHIGGSSFGFDLNVTLARQRTTGRTEFDAPKEAVNGCPQTVRPYWLYGSDQRRSPGDIPRVPLELR
jgi:hypothetical protein